MIDKHTGNRPRASSSNATKTKVRLMAMTAVMLIAGCSASCSKEEPKQPTLREVYAPYFMIGAAVGAGERKADEKEEGFDSLQRYRTQRNSPALLAEFSSLTPENAMKVSYLRHGKGEDEWQWEPADKIVNFATEQGIDVRGHALVWYKHAPDWMFASEGSQAERKAVARERLRAHIHTLMGRYRGAVKYWDVVNEEICPQDCKGAVYRTDSRWHQEYGDASYIRDAFLFAREADPEAKLYYNDFNLVIADKRSRVMTMLEEQGLIRDGLIDGIGIQAHWSLDWPSLANIEATILAFSKLGLDVQITELDIRNPRQDQAEDPKNQKGLADRYGELFALFREQASRISGVTLWGIADDHTWLSPTKEVENYPLLWGTDLKPKTAYRRVRDFGQSLEPETRLEGD